MTTRIAFTGHRHLTTAEVFPGLDLLLKGYVFIFEVSQAYTEEVNTSTGKQRRFDISSAHGFADGSYALLPYAFVADFSEGNMGCNVMTRMPRFARRRVA